LWTIRGPFRPVPVSAFITDFPVLQRVLVRSTPLPNGFSDSTTTAATRTLRNDTTAPFGSTGTHTACPRHKSHNRYDPGPSKRIRNRTGDAGRAPGQTHPQAKTTGLDLYQRLNRGVTNPLNHRPLTGLKEAVRRNLPQQRHLRFRMDVEP
jgi:hypothetical protein